MNKLNSAPWASIDKNRGSDVRAYVYSDASSVAYGGIGVIQGEEPLIVQGNWEQEESTKSSTWRELKAVERVVFKPK